MSTSYFRAFLTAALVLNTLGHRSQAGPPEIPFKVDPQPGFTTNPIRKCTEQASLPMKAALGDIYKRTLLCSPDFFQSCKTELPVALTQTIGLQPYQSEYVMSTLLAWVQGGGTYLCNLGAFAYKDIMDNNGLKCIQNYAAYRINNCNQQFISLGQVYEYSKEYCRAQDNIMKCYIDAIRTCPNDVLEQFLWDFFKSVMWNSPCRDVSSFVNSGIQISNSYYMIFVLLTISLFNIAIGL